MSTILVIKVLLVLRLVCLTVLQSLNYKLFGSKKDEYLCSLFYILFLVQVTKIFLLLFSVHAPAIYNFN